MDWQLDAAEARVLGALLEKEIATPEYYPLSRNALVNACNQKSNRDPVVAYDESTVESALEGLRAKSLATRLTGRDIRVPKNSQRFTEQFNLGRREAALLCLLLLRGPQTGGELRSRSDRLYQFDDLAAVETTLQHLSELGFVVRLSRYAGSREPRWAHLLAGEPVAPVEETQTASDAAAQSPLAERIAALELEVAALRREFDDFRKRFE
ncbi:MAG: YceH family protein [Bryobacteraceae bacterium]